MKKRAEWMLNFLVRAVFGMVAVWLVNSFLQEQGAACSVGINPVSFLTTGFLGFPGLVLLYGLSAYFFL